MRRPIHRNFVFYAIAPITLALAGCVVVGQPGPQTYAQPYPAPPFQPQCQQTPGSYPGQGPTISCTRPDGTVSTTAAPPDYAPPAPPPPDADQGYANPPYPPPPPQGYNGGNGNGY